MAVRKDENTRKETVTVVGRDLKRARERETSETNDTTGSVCRRAVGRDRKHADGRGR